MYCWEMRCHSVCVPHHVLHWYQESCLWVEYGYYDMQLLRDNVMAEYPTYSLVDTFDPTHLLSLQSILTSLNLALLMLSNENT